MHNESNLEFRVGYAPLSGLLYAGQVRRDTGKWLAQPHDVTSWALLAVAQKLSREGKPDGRVIRLSADLFTPGDQADADE